MSRLISPHDAALIHDVRKHLNRSQPLRSVLDFYFTHA
jgi:hypothetical protein